MPEVIVRKASKEDAPEIANAHVSSWREAYQGLLPQEYLDRLPLSFRERMQAWRRIAQESDKLLYVAESSEGIVGFSAFCPAREPGLNGHGELGALYLLEKFKGQGIGTALLRIGMKQLSEWRYNKAYCWVLEKNPTISFYEKSGARFSGQTKTDTIDGLRINELVYVWDSLARFR